jgi:hypothetical protein
MPKVTEKRTTKTRKGEGTERNDMLSKEEMDMLPASSHFFVLPNFRAFVMGISSICIWHFGQFRHFRHFGTLGIYS